MAGWMKSRAATMNSRHISILKIGEGTQARLPRVHLSASAAFYSLGILRARSNRFRGFHVSEYAHIKGSLPWHGHLPRVVPLVRPSSLRCYGLVLARG